MSVLATMLVIVAGLYWVSRLVAIADAQEERR